MHEALLVTAAAADCDPPTHVRRYYLSLVLASSRFCTASELGKARSRGTLVNSTLGPAIAAVSVACGSVRCGNHDTLSPGRVAGVVSGGLP